MPTGIKLTTEEMKYIALFQDLTRASVMDCVIDEDNNRIIFLVKPGEVGLAVGRGGINVKRMKRLLGKDIEVVEYAEKLEDLVKNALMPARVKSVKLITTGDGRKVVYVRNGEEYEKDFDVLVIATGSKGRRLKVEGSDLKGIFTARTMDDFKSIDEYIRKRNVKKAAIVGAGFIAAEVAEALTMRNIKTYVLHRGETILRKLFDKDFAKAIMSTMSAHGVVFMPGRHVQKYVGENGYVKKVFTEEGDVLDVDMVIEAIGVTPNVELARKAGVEISEKTGAIKVNEYMETNLKDVYAVGDCASSFNAVTSEEESSMLATTAFRQARVAAYNILGRKIRYPGHLGTSGLKAFELYAGTTGLINAIAKNKGIDSIAVTLSLPSNPHYYPDAVDIRFKFIVDKNNGRIIGAQALSRKNIADLVTAASFLIMNKMSVLDVTVMDWCYTPPLSYDWNVIVEAAFQAVKRLKIL